MDTAKATTVVDNNNVVIVSTVAGRGFAGFADGPAHIAQFQYPSGIALDANNSIFVTDYNNHRVRKIDPFGNVSTIAGNGLPGGEDGKAELASFNGPYAIELDVQGSIIVVARNNHQIRKITPDGKVCTLAGTGTPGYADGNGSMAQFKYPSGIGVDSFGDIYVTDYKNNRIRKITPQGFVSTVAGSGATGWADGPAHLAQFNGPTGIAIDSLGNLFVTEYDSHRVRKISVDGMVTTIAGSGAPGCVDGVGRNAQFFNPRGIAVDGQGNIFISDVSNHRIRKVDTKGHVTTIAGTGTSGFVDGPALSAQFSNLRGVVLDNFGNLYVTDGQRVRKVSNVAVGHLDDRKKVHTELEEDMLSLLKVPELSDISIMIQDKVFYLHKPVLLARCKDLIDWNGKKLDSISIAAFEQAISFVYSSTCSLDPLPVEEIFQLVKFSWTFQQRRLMIVCERTLLTIMRENNVVDILLFAEKYTELSGTIEAGIWFVATKYSMMDKAELDKLANVPSLANLLAAQLKQLTLSQPHRIILPESNLSNELLQLFTLQLSCDVELDIISEQTTTPISIFVHKCILAARSEYFAQLFRSNIEEEALVRVQLSTKMPFQSFKAMIEYLYSGDLQKVSAQDALWIYAYAKDYSIESPQFLEQLNVIINHTLSTDNCVELYQAGHKFQNEDLKKEAMKVIIGHYDVVVPQLKQIRDLHLLTEILLEVNLALWRHSTPYMEQRL